jgi:prolyl 4-hydroxylase
MAPKVNTVVGYLLPLLAVYFLVYIPLFQKSAPIDSQPSECSPETFARVRNTTIDILPNTACPEHSYTINVLHRDPLIIYIPHFVSDAEADHLVEISLPEFHQSTIYDGTETKVDTRVRNSEVALIPDTDLTVQCVASRALSFQGYPPNVYVEKFRTQRYGIGGHYSNHYDWTGASRKADRVSTFMVYLAAEGAEGGGTNFPRIAKPRPMPEKWCEFFECGDEGNAESILGGGDGEGMEGLTFKPVKGSAVFWENLRPSSAGRGGYEETWHAGLPVRKGTKIGLNVWSWLQEC